MNKRGGTITNFALIIGSLAIGVVILLFLQRMNVNQAKFVADKEAQNIVSELSNSVTKLSNYPSGGVYSVKIYSKEPFTATIDGNTVTVNFPELKKNFTEFLNIPNEYILPSKFSNEGKTFIQHYGKFALVSNSQKIVCNLTDANCDSGCVLLGKCDPACYSQVSNGVCDPYCVDINGDGVINYEDMDGVCDPDCYSSAYKGGVYDPDCVKDGDGVCDPNSNMVYDGVCDKDCEVANGVCDPDCKSLDPDCPSKGNGICQPTLGENCKSDPEDCGCSVGEVCIGGCPTNLAQPSGCIAENKLLKNGQKCKFGCECESKNCIYEHCCPEGEYYDEKARVCVSFKNDNKCEDFAPFFEKCDMSDDNDCECSHLNLGECCPSCEGSLKQGCCPKGQVSCNGKCTSIKERFKKGESCECDAQCLDGLYCSEDKGSHKRACCPKGLVWNEELKKCVSDVCSYPCTPGCKLPEKWDWRNVDGKNYVTPIRDQGHCGSCWAFSTVGAIEGEYKLETHCPSCEPDLSEEELISCDFGGTCNGGLPDIAFEDIKNYNGIVTESCFPYVAHEKRCSDKCQNWMENRYTITSYHQASDGTAERLKRELICHGPLSVASFNWGHGIVLVGYDDNQKVWIIKNSWGPITGYPYGIKHVNGFGYIPYNHPYADIVNYAYYATGINKAK